MRNLVPIAFAFAAALTIWSGEITKDSASSRIALKPKSLGAPLEHQELSGIDVILKSGNRGYSILQLLDAAKRHVKTSYPLFSTTNAYVTVWVDPALSTNSVRMFFFHGFDEQAIRISVGIDGSLIEHTSFIAKEGN